MFKKDHLGETHLKFMELFPLSDFPVKISSWAHHSYLISHLFMSASSVLEWAVKSNKEKLTHGFFDLQ